MRGHGEYCEGQPLDEILEQREDGRLGVGEALNICIQVCRGLQHAHEHGLIHRDIKPSNIFLCADGTAKIMDLGLAKDLAEADTTLSVSPAEPGQAGPNASQCNPHYTSPERAQGECDSDGRTDIYSVGAMLYHLLTGQTPFTAPGLATVVLKAHLRKSAPDAHAVNPSVPPGAAQIIQRAMAKQRHQRYSNCADLASELELVRAGRTPTQRIPAPPFALPRPVAVSCAQKLKMEPDLVIPVPIQRVARESSRRTTAPTARRRKLRRLTAYGLSVLAGLALLGAMLLIMRGSATAPVRPVARNAEALNPK